MDPNDKDNLPAIGMANVLKKADMYDNNNSAARDRRRKVCKPVGICVLGESSLHTYSHSIAHLHTYSRSIAHLHTYSRSIGCTQSLELTF